MRVSSSLFTNNLMSQMNQLQSQQAQLQTEVSSGLTAAEPGDNPDAMGETLDLQTTANANTQYASNITQLQGTASTTGDALSSLQTIVEQAGEIATSSDSTASSTQMTSYAAQVGNLIQEALQAANTQDTNGNYVFGGAVNNQPPFVATTDANGNVTGVTYQGNTDTPQSQIGADQTASGVMVGANTSGTGPQGVLVNSSTGADLFNHLIQLQQDLTSGNVSNISSTDSPNLTNDENNIVEGVASNGVTQASLETASTASSQLGEALTTQSSNLTSADMATTLTNLDQVQSSLQAAMQSGVMIMNLSILSYLH
jgi:flagellar hook-associated protein 3 FlgL